MGVALAGLCGAVFLHFFPDLARGPYGAIDPQLIPILLNESEEAKPILKTGGGWIHVVDLLGMSLLALPTALLFLGRGQKAERWKWGAVSLMLAAALGLTFFYQYRFLGMTAALGLLPLTALLSKGWRRIGATLEGRPKVLAEIGLLLLVAPLPALFIPALFDSRSFNIGIVLFPVDAGRAHCDMARLEYTLRDPRDLGSRSLLIASSLDMGPEILFRTDHKVLAAPFHTNVQGNLDAERFFSTNFPSESRNIAERRGIDLIVGCRFVAPRFLNKKGEAPSLLKTLFDNAPPTWLEAISAPDIGPFVLYRTRLNQAPPEAKTSHP